MDHQRQFSSPFGVRPPFRPSNERPPLYQEQDRHYHQGCHQGQERGLPPPHSSQFATREPTMPSIYDRPALSNYAPVEQQNASHYNSAISHSSNVQSKRIVIDTYGSDLYMDVDSSELVGCPRHENGFEYMWAGCRVTHGAYSGKVCFECHILEALPVNMPKTETTPNVLRVGWSAESSSIQLGEDQWSYGYGGTGKASTNNKFLSYGQRFGAGDVVTCYADLEASPKVLFYAVNGVYLGVAFTLEPDIQGRILFPHVSVKNMKFRLNFGEFRETFSLIPGFTMLGHCLEHSLQHSIYGPADQRDAEVLMMVGLPAAGKSYWAENYTKSHPEKKYCILGTNNILERMRIMKLARKRNYHGRWEALIKQATAILNQLLKIAEKRIRNYIIDQTNVYASARSRKMHPFHGYHRIAVVVINDNLTLQQHTAKREKEEGKLVPIAAVMDMKQNFSLPQTGESFNDIWYVDFNEEQACQLIKQFNEEGRQHCQSISGNSSSNNNKNRNPVQHNSPRMPLSSSYQGNHQLHSIPGQNIRPKMPNDQHHPRPKQRGRRRRNTKPYSQNPQQNDHTPRPLVQMAVPPMRYPAQNKQLDLHVPKPAPMQMGAQPMRYPNQDHVLPYQAYAEHPQDYAGPEGHVLPPRMPYVDQYRPRFEPVHQLPIRHMAPRVPHPHHNASFRPHGRY